MSLAASSSTAGSWRQNRSGTSTT